MQIWTETHTLQAIHPIISTILKPGDLFLDIETTGLSRSRHQIYLIGIALIVDNNIFYVNQWFAESAEDESCVLQEFSSFLQTSEIKRIITFNGNQFDLPFLLARAKFHAINLTFDPFELFDIYKEVVRRKQILQLQNYRQKTIEQFLGLFREDQFTGGELINVYEDYVVCPNEQGKHLLKLHNYEDVLGMMDLLEIFAYDSFFSAPAQVSSASIQSYRDLEGNTCEELIAALTPPCELPGCLSCTHPITGAYLHASGMHVRLRVPLFQGMARLYYTDYKNYWYLPAEDMSIHKSVATYVDKSHKQKATPETCYSKVAVDDAFLHSEKLAEYVTHVLQGFLLS